MNILSPAFGKKDFEDLSVLKSLNKIFIDKRGFSFKMPPKNEPVLLIVSGGLDSTLLWFLLLEKYQLQVYPVHFFNPHKPHRGQIDAVRYFEKEYQKRYPALSHHVYFQEDTSLFRNQGGFNKQVMFYDLPILATNLIYHKGKQQHGLMLISNPARFGHFVFNGYQYSCHLRFTKGIKIQTMFAGIVPDDKIVGREPTLTVLRSINLSFCLILGDFQWQFSAPVEKEAGFYWTKKQLILYALKNNLPVEKTRSCTKDSGIHCGFCVDCRSRQAMFRQMGLVDKTEYQWKKTIEMGKKLPIKKKLSAFVKKIEHLFADRRNRSSRPIHIFPFTRFHINNEILWHEQNNEVYILDKLEGVLERLNDSASFIWKEIAQHPQRSFSELLILVEKNFSVTKKRAKNDIEIFLKRTIKKGYLSTEDNHL